MSREMDEYNKFVDSLVRKGLEQWVSELEPIIMYRQGEIIPYGIGIEGGTEPVIWL